MVMQADAVFLDGLDVFSGVVADLQGADWERPSPCADWRAVDVLGHVGIAVRFGTALLCGDAPTWEPVEPPGAAVEGDPGTWWRLLVDPAKDAVRGADLTVVIDSPVGERSIAEGLSFPALDLFVHAWDLGRVVGVDVEVPTDVIDFGHAALDPIPDDQKRSARVFAAPAPAPPNATPSQSFLAWTGRDPSWSPPA